MGEFVLASTTLINYRMCVLDCGHLISVYLGLKDRTTYDSEEYLQPVAGVFIQGAPY